MENQPGMQAEVLQLRDSVIIVRSNSDLSLYMRAAELAEGTTLEVLPSDPAAIDAFLEDRNATEYDGIDLAAHASDALRDGATFVRVTEDLDVRSKTPGNFCTYFQMLKERE